MPIFAAVLGHVLTNKRLTAALLASLAQLARAGRKTRVVTRVAKWGRL